MNDVHIVFDTDDQHPITRLIQTSTQKISLRSQL